MQAIQVKYMGPTEGRGARIKAWCEAGSVTISREYSVDIKDSYKAAAIELCRKLEWNGMLAHGGLKDGTEVFVFVIPRGTIVV